MELFYIAKRCTYTRKEISIDYFSATPNFFDTVYFTNADFNGEAHFQNVIFNDTTEFSYAKFKDRAYFTGASFINSADFSEADIFLTMKINWSQLEGKLVYNDYFYQSLIRNFETLGQSSDWRDAYYEYHVEKRKHLQSSFDRIVRRPIEWIFLDLSCGYGVRPIRAIGCAGGVIGLFAIFYWGIEVEGRLKKLKESVKFKERLVRLSRDLIESVKEKISRLSGFVHRLIKGRGNKKSEDDLPFKERLKRLSRDLIESVKGKISRLRGFVKEKWKRFLDFIKGVIKGKENEKTDANSSFEDRKKGWWETFKDWSKKALDFVFLSVGIFTTLGILNGKRTSEEHPAVFRILAIIEVFLGWILMTLFVISITLTFIR